MGIERIGVIGSKLQRVSIGRDRAGEIAEFARGISQIVKCPGKIGLACQRLFKRYQRFVSTPFRQQRRSHIVAGIGVSRHLFQKPAVKIDRLAGASEFHKHNAGVVDRVSVILPKLNGMRICRQRLFQFDLLLQDSRAI